MTNLKLKPINFISLVLSFLFLSISPVYAQSEIKGAQYQIQAGDTLGSIAELFGVQIDSLVQINNITDPNSIFPGQVIIIPGLEHLSGFITPVTLQIYDSFDSIVKKYNGDPSEIINLNQITSKDELIAGSIIFINYSEIQTAPAWLIIDHGISLLENAIFLDVSPETIAGQNDIPLIPQEGIVLPPNLDFSSINRNNIDISISISPLPLVQGSTITIRIASDKPLKINGNLAGNELSFFSEDSSNYFALQGINALAKTGLTQLVISVEDSTGGIQIMETNILLQPGVFATDPVILVDPSTIDPQVTKPESDFINSLVSNPSPHKFWSGKFISPAYYQEYTSFFGSRRTYNDNPEITFHGGVDFGGGETLPIIAPADGKIVFAGYLPIRGNATFIDHGLGIYSAYFHQSKLFIIEGDLVTKEQLIGEVGNTGRVSNAGDYPGAGAHLHWEIWVNGNQVDPLDWLSNEYP